MEVGGGGGGGGVAEGVGHYFCFAEEEAEERCLLGTGFSIAGRRGRRGRGG